MGIAGMESFNYFLFDRKALPYNRLPYNNCSERAIEIPLAVSFLQDRGAGWDEAYLEIGNVLAYYKSILDRHSALDNRVVLDKFEEAPGVLNVDLMDYAVKYSTIVCLSTLEHVGQHAYGESKQGDRGAPLLALRQVYNLLKPDGEALVTVPYGLLMDLGWLIQFSGDYLDLLTSRFGVPATAVRISYFRKLDMEMTFDAPRQTWVQCEREELAETRFDSPFVFANGIAVIRLRKLGPDIATPPPAGAANALQFHPPVTVGSLYVMPFVRPGGYDPEGYIPANAAGYVFYGPNMTLAPQMYRLEALIDVAGSGRFVLEMTAEGGRRLLWSRSFAGTQLVEGELETVAEERDVELRLYKINDSDCRVRVPRLLLTPTSPTAAR